MNADQAREAFQQYLNTLPWDSPDYMPPLDQLMNYANGQFGRGTGLSFQEMHGIARNAYYSNGVPENPNGGFSQSTSPAESFPGYPGDKRVGTSSQELETMLAEHKSKVSQINQAYQDGLMDWDTKSKALEDSRNTILGQRKQGEESNAAYFSNVSPDAFQSQIGNYNTKVLDAYTQGSNTLDNNQKEIDYYKGKLDAGHKSDTGYYGSYDQGTGKYDAGAYVAPGVINAPTINSTIGNPYDQAAKLGVPSWAPNYGGMSVQQAAKTKEDEINRYLG